MYHFKDSAAKSATMRFSNVNIFGNELPPHRDRAPFISHILTSIHPSPTLAGLRDALLPTLISGEVRLPDAERIIGEQMRQLGEDFEASSAWHRIHLALTRKTFRTAAKLYRQVAIIGPQVL